VRPLSPYVWPCNVRDLLHAIECAWALSSDTMLTVDDFEFAAVANRAPDHVPEAPELIPLSEIERRALVNAVRETGGNKVAAARLLGIGKTTLYRKLKEYGP